MEDVNLKPRESTIDSGSLIYEGNEIVEADITLIEYNKESRKEEKFEECRKFKNEDAVKWVKINGYSRIEIQEMGRCFNLHPLVLEDINTDQRPKIEEYKDYLFLVVKKFNKVKYGINTEQISFILGKNFVISFQEQDTGLFKIVEKQISIKESIIRDNSADFLLYSLLDTVVDSYYTILEEMEDEIDFLEKELINNASKKTLNSINALKRDIITLRKGIWPLKEVTSTLKTSNFPLITDTTDIYLRDVYDHSIQVSDMLDTFRDTVSGMLDTYLSSMSNNLNEIVRVLTIISVIFVPLTFITGFFGMNFQNMVEVISITTIFTLAVIIMITTPLVMLFYFKRKGWLD
ncbi:magnesium/cobalt transporter CorA [Methanobacterium sp. ACI-7]|uniref:magnesium/cobalt transporter CorA n=1 Tax=unclassified Methanobacterium TaxID=2627676 RepID=UPI0039C17B5F